MASEHFTEAEASEIYGLLARYSANFPIDSQEYYLLTKEMADVRGRM